MADQRPSDTYSGLSEEVGARLSERRTELNKTLRSVASEAEMSASHLSDIENGRSQVSLPVLLRLMRSLDLTVGELLPRIGGSRTKEGSLAELDGPSSVLSHEQLELTIVHHHLEVDEFVDLDNPGLADLLIHVLAGSVIVEASGSTHDLGTGDTLDSERLRRCRMRATATASVVTATRTEAP